MGQPRQPDPATFTRRTVLAATAGIGVAALLGSRVQSASAAASPSSTTLHVDFGATAFHPLVKSKIGVARALNSTEILDSLPYLDEIRPALYNAELRFPNTDWPSLTPYPIEVGEDGKVTVLPNDFLDTLYAGLYQRNIEIMHQLMGAPKQWWDYANAFRPHLFPFPTDLPAAANALGLWAKLYSGSPISYCIWNEPSHNLTGSPDLRSINQMVDIYDAYTSAIAPHAPQGSFGMASFIPPNAIADPDLGGRTYVEATIDELRRHLVAKPDLPFNYLTMNNYGKDPHPLYDAARNALGTDFNTVPLIQSQYGVFGPGDWKLNAGITLEAAKAMTSLELALRVPDLQVFSFSGWLPHMIEYQDDGTALQLPLFNALKLYARMPDHRASTVPDHRAATTGELPSGVGVMASGDRYRSSVMLWNETSQPQSIELRLADIALPSQSDTMLTVYHIDSEHGSPLEHSSNDFTPTETTQVSQSVRSLTKTVTIAGPGIAYLEIGTAHHPILDRNGPTASLVRKHSYADRITDSDGTTSVRGNAYGCYDAVRAIGYLGIQGDQGTALCGAEYRDLPDTLGIDIWTDLLVPHPSSSEAMFGTRVDYIVGDSAAQSVLWHGDIFDSRRTTSLPWGRGGPTADILIDRPELDSGAGECRLVLDLAGHAPSGWAQAGRHAIISFWMDSTGPGSQARFVLG